MRYRFIRDRQGEVSVAQFCRRLGVSRSGYYKWLKAPLGKRAVRNRELKQAILRIFTDSRRIYGSPRVHAMLRREGALCNRKRVARLMREMGLRSIIKRKYKATTNSRHNRPVSPNHLQRRFDPSAPNLVWAGDVTYVPTEEGWLYLAVVLDLYSRKVVGWSMGPWINSDLVRQALDSAIRSRRPAKGLLFHSDQGVQYASIAYQGDLLDYQITGSMSRKGNCYDNAVVESFFNSLKQEWLFHRRFADREEAKRSIFEYIECFYNRQRLHSTLGYRSPEEFEALCPV